MKQKKIAIIGGGISGMTAAWLLEKEHVVHLFESAAELGGDAKCIEVPYGGKNYSIDTRVHVFVNGYHKIISLMRLFGVKLKKFKLGLYLPPGLLTEKIQKPIHMVKKLSFDIDMLVRIKYYKFLGDVFRYDGPNITIKEYLAKNNKKWGDNNWLENMIKAHIFFLLVYDDTDLSTMVYDLKGAIKYSSAHLIDRIVWAVNKGVVNWVHAFEAQLTNTQFFKETPILNISKSSDNLFNLQSSNNVYSNYDVIIFAVKPNALHDLVVKSGLSGFEELSKIKSCDTLSIIHNDSSFMPSKSEKYMIVNYNGNDMELVWMGQAYNIPIFETVLKDTKDENPISQDHTFVKEINNHYKFDDQMNNVRMQINSNQGKNDLYIAGCWLKEGTIFQEAAAESAVDIVKMISPHSKRLQWLLKTSEKSAKIGYFRKTKLYVLNSIFSILEKYLDNKYKGQL